LNENIFEFQMEGKPLTPTIAPATVDTIFASDRTKIISFNQDFNEAEQDKGLKRELRKEKVKNAILNWMVMG
jgi:phage/plasmid-associated DNA primase